MSRKKYEKKEESSKSTYVNFYDILIKSGKSLSVIKHIPNTRKGVKSFNKMFGTHLIKISSLKAKKSLISQIKNDSNAVVSDYIKKEKVKDDKFKEFLFNRTYELLNIKEEETKEIKKVKDINVIDFKPIIKEGQYGVSKITNLKNNQDYFIKYTSEKKLNQRIEKLKQQYKIENFVYKLLGIYMYQTYITERFKENLRSYKIT